MKMSDSKVIFYLVFCFIGLCSYQSLKIVPERAQLHYYDKQYFEYASLNVRRARRGGDYVVNFNVTLLQYLGNNVSLFISFYEFLSNEYKPSFVQLHFKLCDLILKDKLLGPTVRNVGLVTCPVIPGPYVLKNFGFDVEIPSLFPFEKGMFQGVFKHDAKPNGIIVKGNVMFHVVKNVPQKRKHT